VSAGLKENADHQKLLREDPEQGKRSQEAPFCGQNVKKRAGEYKPRPNSGAPEVAVGTSSCAKVKEKKKGSSRRSNEALRKKKGRAVEGGELGGQPAGRKKEVGGCGPRWSHRAGGIRAAVSGEGRSCLPL